MTRFIKSILAVSLLWAPAIAQTKQPNIVLIMADDMGFSDIGAYGGEVQTPNINRLAAEGIKFKQFYNAARCCPTRAALMTGLYPHQAGMGWMANADLGTPAYQDNLNNTSVTIAEVLKGAGYDTYMTGKWHLTNERKIDGNVIANWPKQRGFNRYFGIIPGGANYYTPELYSDNHRYKAPENFYLTNAISDTSVKFIEEHLKTQPNKPMFMYVAYTSPHWPLHALKADIEKYKDYYKGGWDGIRKKRFERQKELGLMAKDAVLSPRDTAIKDWESLSPQKREEMAMRMAIYAAQIDIMDQGIGRIIAKLKAANQLDNTLIFFLSDNGACAEFVSSGETKEVNGEKNSFESYRLNWANVSSTPFKEYKHYTDEGGIATPLIVHWPQGISKSLNNTFASGYGHVSDIMATCVDVAHATYPAVYRGNKITPLEGHSIAAVFGGKALNRGQVFWEHEANIAVRDGKWKLVAATPEDEKFDVKRLRLYDMDVDPTEMNDLAKSQPDRVKAMYADWVKWGNKVGVFPLDTRGYGVRAQAYKRNINGNFDDLLGGWKVKNTPTVEGKVSIDTTAQISGKNSLKVEMSKPGDRPLGLVVSWPFKAKKGEKFTVTFNSKSNRNTSYFVRLEKANGDAVKFIDQTVNVTMKPGVNTFSSTEIPQNDDYKLAFYFGKLAADDKVWIDDVKMTETK